MAGSVPDRPTTDVSVVVLDSLDQTMRQLLDRLHGMTDAEHRWEPVTPMWSARLHEDGHVRVDGAGERDADPAPATTIAWRLWHLSVDCLDDYRRRLGGDGRDLEPDPGWFLEAAPAVAALERSWDRYRSHLAGTDRWWDPLGPAWGPWSEHSLVDMALHAGRELNHHGAEIGLLRDLYRAERATESS